MGPGESAVVAHPRSQPRLQYVLLKLLYCLSELSWFWLFVTKTLNKTGIGSRLWYPGIRSEIGELGPVETKPMKIHLILSNTNLASHDL